MGTTAMALEDIKKLREQTGAGIMEAKRALQDADGNLEKARVLLEQRGALSAAKRAGREAAQGLVEPYIHAGGQIGVIVELNSETDFVARMPEFKELAHEIALHVAATNPRYLGIEEIPEGEAEQIKSTSLEQALKEGKPEKIAANIAEGRLKKYAQEHVLLEQAYVRDESKTIKQLIQDLAGKTRENIVIRRFSRFQVGG